MDEQRKISFQRTCVQSELDIIALHRSLTNLKFPSALCRILTVFDASSYIKHTVGNVLFASSIMNMGTKRHQQYIDDAEDGKVKYFLNLFY